MNKIVEIIAQEIKHLGVISFARFMELALYCPDCGYYEKEQDKVGRRGDFFTSVSVGNLFGELLAFQFAEWLEPEIRNQKSQIRIVEAGAHNGQLAKDILIWLREHRPEIFKAVEYCIIEPSTRRQEWQKAMLAEFQGRICWLSELKELHDGVYGIIFSNELLDAMPVHRLGWDAKNKIWFEWGVVLEDEKFVWTEIQKLEAGSRKSESDFQSVLQHLPLSPELLALLPDGFIAEISPAAKKWWHETAGILKRGKLLAIDYGLTAEEFFALERSEGTLRAYYRHHLTNDVLANPGEQDITAHVNFTAIQNAGESAGLKNEAIIAQSRFLTQIVERTTKNPSGFGPWDSARSRQFQTLTHPDHLGRAFRVMIQSR